jgi:thioredoxin-like negative regulator of GroEL
MSESRPPDRGGEFFTLLGALRVFRNGPLAGDPSDRALARAAGRSPTTIGDWLQGRRFPQDIGKVLVMVRMVRTAAARRGVTIPDSGRAGLLDEDRWRAAYLQEAQRRAGVITGGAEQTQAVWALAGPRVRVRGASLRVLGVHAAIRVPGMRDEVPPEYVPRDVDAAEFGVRAKVGAAAQRGGFVLLVGGSSVGKTRCAVETVKALLPDWWLIHPGGPAEVHALAQAPPQRTVVWLDELQRYLDGEHGLTGATVRALLNASHPVMIIGTMWPDRYNAYIAVPASGGADPHAREREVLDLAAVIRIAPEFTSAEQDRARAAATRDARLRVALNAAGYGLTQTLAAAPQLVARWEDAQTIDPYGWAVLTGALDAARLGARAPLNADFLRAAAPGYCTSQQQAEAPSNWFEQALAYATGKLHGAAAALSPAGTGMGQVAGYIPADYLIQHASRERHYARPPASTWDAILTHVRDPADIARLAYSAKSRLLYCYVTPLYRHAADAGDRNAASRLAELLAERGELDELRARAETGDSFAASRLAELLEERGDPDGATQVLRTAAETGDSFAASRLARLLEERGDVDGATQILRARTDAGDSDAAFQLARLLEERGDLDGATQILRARTDAGDSDAAFQLARLLEERGDPDGAAQILRARADAGDNDAASRLAWLLAERGDVDRLRTRAEGGDSDAAFQLAELLEERGDPDGATQILRARADAGDSEAASRLAWLLAGRADLDGLRARAEAGDSDAASWLARLLAKRGNLGGLRARADAGDSEAAFRLAWLLEERGDLDGATQALRTAAAAGDRDAALRLARLLEERGDLDGLRAAAKVGDRDAAFRLAQLLEWRGDLDGATQALRAAADAGDSDAAYELAWLLAKRRNLDGLRARADAGDWYAALRLAELLEERGDLNGLRARADAGDRHAADQLAELLYRRGDPDGLRARADAGDSFAALRLAELLEERGDRDGAAQVLRAAADAGDSDAALRLARLLYRRGDLNGLRARADAGDRDAASRLPDLIAEQGRDEEAERLRRFGLNPDGSIANALRDVVLKVLSRRNSKANQTVPSEP